MISLRTYADAYVASMKNDAVAEFDAGVEVLNAVKTLRAFLPDASVSLDAKQEALKIALPKTSEATRNFLLLLAADGKLEDLDALQSYVRQAAAALQDKRHATVTSAVPLQAKERTRVEKALADLFKSDVEMEERTDPSLLSGFSVQVGGWTFDASLKGRLERLQHALTV